MKNVFQMVLDRFLNAYLKANQESGPMKTKVLGSEGKPITRCGEGLIVDEVDHYMDR